MSEQRVSENWVSRRELADHFGVSIDKVDEMVRDGCPSIKLTSGPRGARRFLISKAEAWVAEQNEAAA